MSPADVLLVSGVIGALVLAAGTLVHRPKRLPVRVRHDDDQR
ncbi:hypothetical protein [Cellulomonas sp. URHD0024]|nr:hypothetical protein [Cellulomonas sp. URHD0024]